MHRAGHPVVLRGLARPKGLMARVYGAMKLAGKLSIEVS